MYFRIKCIFFYFLQERRKKAVLELLKVLRPGGKALIYVWAVEQELNKVKSKYLKNKTEKSETVSDIVGLDKVETYKQGSVCDSEMAEEWNGMKDGECSLSKNVGASCSSKTACQDISSSNKQLEVHVNRTEFKQQDVLVPWQLKNKNIVQKEDVNSSPETFHRFYHVFHKGELEVLCESTGLCKVVESYYDQGNWAVVLERTEE